MLKTIIFISIFITTASYAKNNTELYLTKEDQKFFKNDVMEGNNQFERINMNVREINKLHGEIAGLKAEVQLLKKELQELKQGK